MLGSVSLLGESAVDITPASNGTPIPDWGYVPAGPVPASIADVTASAQTGIQETDGAAAGHPGGQGDHRTAGSRTTRCTGIWIRCSSSVTEVTQDHQRAVAARSAGW